MNQNIKTKWLEALRSGQYQQVKGVLRHSDSANSQGYCCLGVLCDIYSKETATPWVGDSFLGHTCVLPLEIIKRCDISINQFGGLGLLQDSLSQMNDHGKTFNDIADVIEEKL